MRGPAFLRLIWLLWLLTFSVAARAQDSAAQALFREGRLAMKQGDIAVACEHFRASFELKQTLGTQLNLAICEESLGNFPRAWELHSDLLAKFDAQDARRAVSVKRLRKLQSQVARLMLKLDAHAPADSEAREQSTDQQVPLDVVVALMPGRHQFSVFAPDREANEYLLSLDAAEERTLLVSPGAPVPKRMGFEQVEPQSVHPHGGATNRGAWQAGLGSQADRDERARTPVPAQDRTWGTIALGAGGAAMLASGAAAVLVLRQKQVVASECEPTSSSTLQCTEQGLHAGERGKLYSNIATAAFALGVVSAGVGVYLLLPSEGTVSARVSPASVQFSASHSF